ncbi:MAG TPA: UDP-N-acetylglucosamine--N-acetylmuramyl-(pentapeptide) pyrophosphoryl-undecaprenol N-acetylglucosamine transferase, partial [Phaeodactylibacter sp.]|nr:UDP-N-acetylglucosamine--N-acetylmuramyl-(pentapeptide) pyrophosphoryl-undecaprenol N-acetylglucosamine transferase [Phaeodactylibacter sp.]
MWKAQKIINRFKPQVAVGVGGYASYPTLAVAARKGIPTLIQEQNSYAGITNKMLKNKVRTVCVAYDHMERYFPSSHIVWTGNPVRKDLQNLEGKKEKAIKHFGFKPNKKYIVVMGGSLGARSLNDSMRNNADLISQHKDIQILWQAGKLYIEEFQKSKTAQLENVKIQAFIKRMDLAYALADVVIARAGALTISELCLLAKPAILVPSPNVAEDHQTKNATALVEKQAAILVKDKNANAMVQQAIEILEDEQQRMLLANNIQQLAKPDAARHIAEEVCKLIN